MDDILDRQLQQWESTYSQEPNLYGELPSLAARRATQQFKAYDVREIIELGCGHGRDTLFFAQCGLTVHALDYSRKAIDTLKRTSLASGFSKSITPLCHDVRNPLPFDSETIEGSYSHMLYSMALTTTQLKSLSKEVKRILKPNGLNIFTVRTNEDPHYARGIARGDDMYENEGFIVRFFDPEKVQSLAEGYEIIGIHSFQEGELPRKLFCVTLRKKA